MHTLSSLQVTADRGGDTPLTFSLCLHTTVPTVPAMNRIHPGAVGRLCYRPRALSQPSSTRVTHSLPLSVAHPL